MRGQFWSFLLGAALLFAGGSARAACTKDTECKGERVCNEGKCVDPAPVSAAPVPAAAPAPAAPPAASPPASAAPATEGSAPAREPKPAGSGGQAAPDLDGAASPPMAAPRGARVIAAEPQPDDGERFFDEEKKPRRVRKRFKNPALLAAGIVVAGSGPIVLMVGAFSFKCDQNSCSNNYAGYGLAALALIGAGVPMIVIGSKREPIGQALLVPWATTSSAGLALDLRL